MDSSFQSYLGDEDLYATRGFNPCFNGFFFSIIHTAPHSLQIISFNPCFNGFFFSIIEKLVKMAQVNSFNPCFNGFFFSISCLIVSRRTLYCFNPCFNGFFFSISNKFHKKVIIKVSILVLMDSSFQL